MLDASPCKSDRRAPATKPSSPSSWRTTSGTTVRGTAGSGAEGAAFLTKGGTLCLVADDGEALVGFAILNPYFPGPRLTHGLFLKELYVAASARSKGVGEKLIEGIRALAKERGDTRVIWTTGEQNEGSQRFYDRLGMRREKKVYFVMEP